ncbi:AAA family ATPase [Roseovarius faecimaris]
MNQPEASPITACTISRDVQNFDLLIEDMETALGEAWGDLGFSEAMAFFNQSDSDGLEFVAIAIDSSDEEEIVMLGDLITLAKSKKIKVILIAEDVSPAVLHQLLRQGADEFVPYPLPENELQAAIERLNKQPEPVMQVMAAPTGHGVSGTTGDGVLLAVHGLAGGTGATTLATNLAYELATVEKKAENPKVCLLDFDLQFGSVATYLDLPRRDVVYEMWSDTDALDHDIFRQALTSFNDKMQVLTAPLDMLPLDFVSPEDVAKVIALARQHFDYVVIDMPSTLVQWSETVLHEAQVYFATLELDMRSAQNTLRLKRALQAEDLPFEKIRFCLNRAPKFTDLNGKSRVKRMSESLDISIEMQFPDGGKPIPQCNDHGLPLSESAAKNPLRKEIMKLARSLHDLGKDEAEAA